MKFWIGSIAPGTTEGELCEFVKKYATDLEIKTIQRIEGDGSRPAASIEFADTPYGSVEKISMRLNGMYWKNRQLLVQTTAADYARTRPRRRRCQRVSRLPRSA